MVAKIKSSGDAEVIEQDIITDALKTVKAIVDKNNGVVDENSLAEADKIIRAKWWGDRPYIAKNAGEGSSERATTRFIVITASKGNGSAC